MAIIIETRGEQYIWDTSVGQWMGGDPDLVDTLNGFIEETPAHDPNPGMTQANRLSELIGVTIVESEETEEILEGVDY